MTITEIPAPQHRPRLTDLIPEPLWLTRRQRVTALARPWLPLASVIFFAGRGWLIATALCVPLLFVADVVVLHDLFHGNLGLGRRTNTVLVGVYGTLLLNSGHALQATHLQHHRVYPGGDDPEAYVDGWPLWRVLVEGPVYRFHVWAWAWHHPRHNRTMVTAEAAPWLGTWVAAVALHNRLPGLLVFVVIAEIGTWMFPIISVTGVHDRRGRGPLQQSKTLHIPVFDHLMLGMQYHLEHHLYPRVPAARLAEVASVLEPWLMASGAAVTTRQVKFLRSYPAAGVHGEGIHRAAGTAWGAADARIAEIRSHLAG